MEKKKAGKVTLRRMIANVHLIFATLAAASSCEIEVGTEGAPDVRRGEGEVWLPGGEEDDSTPRTIEATLVECDAAAMYILDHHAARRHADGEGDRDVAALVAIFNRFWVVMTKGVSWSGKLKRCVAGAIEDAKTPLDMSDAVLEQVQKEDRKRKSADSPHTVDTLG